MINIQEKKDERLLVLKKAYNLVDGRSDRSFTVYELSEALEWAEDRVQVICDYFIKDNLLERRDGNNILLTHNGVKKIEAE